MMAEVFAATIVQTEVDVVGGLEGEVESYDEWVADLLEDVDLGYGEFYLLV